MSTPFPGRWVSIVTLFAVLAGPVSGQDPAVSRALSILKEAKDSLANTRHMSSSEADLRLAISVGQARGGDPVAAEAGFQEVLQALPEEGVNVALAKVHAGDLKGAIALAETLKDGWISEKGDPLLGRSTSRPGSLRTHALERIAVLLGEWRRWTEALVVVDLLPETKREGHPDDMTSRQEALWKLSVAQAKAGDSEAALKTAKIIKSGYYREEALKEIVLEQIGRGELREAAQSNELLTYPHLRLDALLAMAKTQAGRGDHSASTETFQKAIALALSLTDHFRPTESSRVSALVRISETQLMVGDRKAAEATMALAVKESQELDTYWIAKGEARLGAIDLALTKVQSMSVPWRQVYALAAIARILAQSGNSARADEFFVKAQAITRTIQEEHVRMGALLEIGKAQLESGLISAALETAKELNPGYSEKGDLLQRIIKAQVAGGDLKGARDTAELHPLGWMKANAFYDIAPALARAGDARTAVDLVVPLQGNVRSLSLEAISLVLAERGEFGTACEAALRIEMAEVKGRALRNVAFAQSRKSDEAGARAWISTLKPPFLRASALLGVAQAILQVEGRDR